jgi:hypothetical protein
MVLIQVVLPITESVRGRSEDLNTIFGAVRRELLELVDGVTACLRSATDVWTDGEDDEPANGVRIEVLATTFDRRWWRAYARKLARRFGQRTVCVRVESVGAGDAEGLRRGSLAGGGRDS